MSASVDRPTPGWEEAGARVASALAGVGAVLVTGDDPVAAALAALGMGRAEAARRRVAIGDLVGDVAPLASLVESDDPHGIVDSFLYGVSLNKVARPVAGTTSLFVLPTGTEPEITEEIFRSDRWRRLASGFREVGALLLLVAPVDAPGLETLVEALDGVVAVGDIHGRVASRFDVLATVEPPRRPRPRPAAVEGEPVTGGARQAEARGRRGTVVLPEDAVPPARRLPGWALPALLALVLLAAGGVWLYNTRLAAPRPVARAARPAAPAPRDTTPRDTAAAAAPAAPATLSLTVMNPGDSAAATPYVVLVRNYSTEEGARLEQRQAKQLPLATWFPIYLRSDGSTWYRVVGGAWRTRPAADSGLAALRTRRVVDENTTVLRAPLALLVGSHLAADSARALRAGYEAGGIPVYALRQDDGTTNLYTGAFETPDQSMLLAQALQAMGGVPTLVYRTGRPF